MSDVHLVAVLKMMTEICQNSVTSLDDALATSVADLGLAELPGHAGEQASELLVALSKSQCSQAVGALIIKYDLTIFIWSGIILYTSIDCNNVFVQI